MESRESGRDWSLDVCPSVADSSFKRGRPPIRCRIKHYVHLRVGRPGARRGIRPEFYPDQFRYDPATDIFQCPAGKLLELKQARQCEGRIEYNHRASAADCAECSFRDQCCPESASRGIVRKEDSERVKAFRAKMQTDEAKKIYRTRAQVAEQRCRRRKSRGTEKVVRKLK